MPYGQFLASLDDVAVGLSPICADNDFSRGKSFGKVLAYLDRGVPVVASDEADHSLFFEPDTGVITNDPALWVQAILNLLDDPGRRQSMAERALVALEDPLSVEAAAQKVHRVLEQGHRTGQVSCRTGQGRGWCRLPLTRRKLYITYLTRSGV
jgi:glycosyltransferase involved in cell wall biosynthesis